MANLMQLEIVTPDKSILQREDVSYVLAETVTGGVGILAHHAPLIGALVEGGALKFKDDKEQLHYVFINGGFMEVKDNKVTILCVNAEFAADIDVARAEAALARAEKHLANITPTTDIEVVNRDLQRAKGRLKTAALATKA